MLYLIIGFALYLLIVNVIGFIIMGEDKSRARRGAWRISETTLFTVALIGGALGATWGMHHFRHKTKHWYFRYGFPTILIIQILSLVGGGLYLFSTGLIYHISLF